MAGQPQDPWQSPEQDQTRPAWQPFSPPSTDKQETYSYPESASYPESGQGAQGYDTGYSQRRSYTGSAYPPSQDAPFTGPHNAAPFGAQGQPYGDQALGDTAFDGQAYQAPPQGYQGHQGHQGHQGQQAPHWQAVAGMTAANKKPKSESKGFLGSLFDFSFTSFVTPKIIKVLYVLATVWTVIWALIFLRYGFKYGGAAGGFFTLIVVDPILILLTLGAFRMVLELFMVAHRMHEDMKVLRDRGEN